MSSLLQGYEFTIGNGWKTIYGNVISCAADAERTASVGRF